MAGRLILASTCRLAFELGDSSSPAKALLVMLPLPVLLPLRAGAAASKATAEPDRDILAVEAMARLSAHGAALTDR